jgi:predicted Rossmann-fold nucleotide-binding protein
VILLGTGYWAGLLDWFRGTLLPSGKIAARDLDLITVTDDVAAAVAIIQAAAAQRDSQPNGTAPAENAARYPAEP